MENLQSVIVLLAQYSGEFLIGLAIISLGSLILALVAVLRLRLLMRPFASIKQDATVKAEYLPALVSAVDANRKSLERHDSDIGAIHEEGKAFLRYVGLVQYDAFDDVGGKQSYSLCLLDSERNGVLLTYLTSKNWTRSYAVRVKAGEYSRELGDEEKKAYEEALASINF